MLAHVLRMTWRFNHLATTTSVNGGYKVAPIKQSGSHTGVSFGDKRSSSHLVHRPIKYPSF